MALSTKAIKNRISSVTNTKKITKAMEMVSAAKMRRAIESALGTRSYAELSLELLVNISKDKQIDNPLLSSGKSGKVLALIIASNKGLCGSYNSNVSKSVNEFVKNNSKKNIEYITIGKKAENIVRKAGGKIHASFIEFPDKIRTEDITGLSKIIIDEFSTGKYEAIHMIYTNFVSSLKYIPEQRQLLPINAENVKKMIKELGDDKQIEDKDLRIKDMSVYLFEPNEEEILNDVLPRLTEIQIFQAILESSASEHSARMLAMRNASDSAEDMINDLTLTFNQARQAGITQEIAEIASGAAALE